MSVALETEEGRLTEEGANLDVQAGEAFENIDGHW